MAFDEYICNCVIGFATVLLLAMYLALPVVDILMGIKFRDDVVCDSSIISIPVWLIVKGSISLFLISLHIIRYVGIITKKFKKLVVVTVILIITMAFFLLVWLIVGSITFWRDCKDLNPESVNTLMWCTLIIGYISLLIVIIGSNKSNEDPDLLNDVVV